MNCHSRNIPGICRYIPGIYQKLKRGQAAGSDRNPGPLAFYRGQALCLRLSLTSTYIPDFFCRDVHILIFLILWISSISDVSRMTKGNEASRAASQARKEKETTKKKEGKHETDSSDDSDDDKATEKAAQELRENERKCRLAQAYADSEITDCMIAQAEARNQAKKDKLNLC